MRVRHSGGVSGHSQVFSVLPLCGSGHPDGRRILALDGTVAKAVRRPNRNAQKCLNFLGTWKSSFFFVREIDELMTPVIMN